jgi:hypothetical protein
MELWVADVVAAASGGLSPTGGSPRERTGQSDTVDATSGLYAAVSIRGVAVS